MSARRYLLALSFTNLCYAPVWKHLLDIRTAAGFTMKNFPARAEYAAAICGVLLCAAALVAIDTALRLGPRHLRSVEIIAGIALLILPMQSLLAGYPVRSSLIHLIHIPSVMFFAAAGSLSAAVVVRYQSLALKIAARILLACVPFCAITFASSVYRMARVVPRPDPPTVARINHAPSPRVLWIIFDEWDQRLTFDARPAGLELPALDRLRAESLFAQNALPPSDATLISMTSLISGRSVVTAAPIDSSTLRLKFKDGQSQRFGDDPNLFSDVRRSGRNAAVLGWYLPYCRLFNASATDCWWEEMDAVWNSQGKTFTSALFNQPRSLVETSIFSPFGQSLTTLKHRRIYEELLDRGMRIAADPTIDSALIHFNVPHAPFFYDRATQQMTRGNSLYAYPDALALVDRTLAALRSRMEQAGTWNTTTLLVSSDHFYRISPLVNGKRDQRVPFILHLAGQKRALDFTAPFNTVLTHDLILSLLRAEITDVAAAQTWLANHAVTSFQN